MSERLTNLVECYETLGLPVGTLPGALKSAYRGLMKLWHPDVCYDNPQQAEEHAKRINVAFSCLRSLGPRELEAVAAFHRASCMESARAGPSPEVRRARRPSSDPDSRPVEEMRRRAPPNGASRRNRRGRDVIGKVGISLREATSGARWKFVLPTCRRCGGWGAAIDAELRICESCDGVGLRGVALGMSGPFRVCVRCQGRGGSAERMCDACGGSGESTSYTVGCHVPAGIGGGCCGVLGGFGHPGVGSGTPGDLYLLLGVVGEAGS